MFEEPKLLYEDKKYVIQEFADGDITCEKYHPINGIDRGWWESISLKEVPEEIKREVLKEAI